MNKKLIIILFICLCNLLLISSVGAADESQSNETIKTAFQITSDLSNDDIQKLFDDAENGDTFEFSDSQYSDLSLIVDKKLNIVSNRNSTIYTSNQVTNKGESMGITDTFGFLFTPNSSGSVLSGFTIISDSDYNLIIDSSNKTTIENNQLVGGINTVLIKNSCDVNLVKNNISKASLNGLQLHNVKNSVISNNEIMNCGKSGIETSDIYYCKILNNTIHHNGYNGISMYNISDGNSIKYNDVHDNDNGIFINSTSSFDVVSANSFTYNWNDPGNEEIGGGTETGNGLLFGSGFKTAREGSSSRLIFKYNVLAHNQQYQAKNNPALSRFKLGDNWFDSTDDENTFVCPFLLAGIMKMDTISVKNGIGLQMYDTKGNPVEEFGTFDTKVNVNGNTYTARFINGKAVIDANLDADQEYEIEVMIGGQPVKYKYKAASGEKGDNKDFKSLNENNDGGLTGFDFQVSSSNTGVSKGSGINQNGTSNSAHFANSKNPGVHGTNASGTHKDSSDNGDNALTNGDINSGDSNQGESTKEGKAYEIVPASKISKKITDTSGIVVLSIISLMGMLIYGYWRKEDFD